MAWCSVKPKYAFMAFTHTYLDSSCKLYIETLFFSPFSSHVDSDSVGHQIISIKLHIMLYLKTNVEN